MEQSIQQSVMWRISIYQDCCGYGNLACQQWKSFFDKHGMKANRQYYWDILLSQK